MRNSVDDMRQTALVVPQEPGGVICQGFIKELNANHALAGSSAFHQNSTTSRPGAGSWHLRVLDSSTPECRDGALVTYEGAVYLLGGYRTREPFNNSTESDAMFVPATEIFRLVTRAATLSWQQLPRLTFISRHDLPRPGIIACGHGGGLYIYGGYREDGFSGDMSFIDLTRGACQGLDVRPESSPMEDGIGSRMSSVVHDGRWFVARRLVMAATLYSFDFADKAWTSEELQVEGKTDNLMCIHELAVYGGSLYALNEDTSEDRTTTTLEIRRLQGHTWLKIEPSSTPHWIRNASLMETFYRGAVVNDSWVIWGSRSLQEAGTPHGNDLSNPPTVLTANNLESYYSSDWAAAFEIFPMVFNFTSCSWTALDCHDAGSSESPVMQGHRPISRKLHSISPGSDGRSIYVCGGEMVPVPGSSGVPIPCHVTEQLMFLPPLSKACGHNDMMMPNAGDLLEEVYSCAHQVLDDSLCDVEVYPCSSPELVVRCSSFAMCQRSEVFQRMLTSSMVESSSRRVELPAGVSMSAIKALRHICHLELDALQTCVHEALTLVELYSLCQTYLVQPLGTKFTHSIIEAKLQDPDRGDKEAAQLWDAMYATPLNVVFHQGLPDLITGCLAARYPGGGITDLSGHEQPSGSFQGLSKERLETLQQMTEQMAMQQHVENIYISDQ